jgi:hypothetical protein
VPTAGFANDNFTSQLHDNLEAVEDYAATSVYLAMAMIEEAEAATLIAICDRMDAEAAHGNSKKH